MPPSKRDPPHRRFEIEFIDLRAQRERIRQKIDDAIGRVLDHGRFIMGPEVLELEQALCSRLDVRNTISCSSGSDALILVLRSLGITTNDVVFIPSFTFSATAEAVVHVGATPFFVDIEPETFSIDVGRLEQVLQRGGFPGEPRAVIAVDLYGHPANYEHLRELGNRYGVTIVADAAQSLGAATVEGPVGCLATATTTSFFPAKPLGAYGDGGAVFTNDDELADELRSLRVHGSGTVKYEHVRAGYNARLDTLQAAILLAKLSVFDDELCARDRIASTYTSLLRGSVKTPRVKSGVRSAWAQYTITTAYRTPLADSLQHRGIPAAIYYPVPLHRQDPYTQFPRDHNLEVTCRLASEVLSLPMHPYLGEQEQHAVSHCVIETIAAQPEPFG